MLPPEADQYSGLGWKASRRGQGLVLTPGLHSWLATWITSWLCGFGDMIWTKGCRRPNCVLSPSYDLCPRFMVFLYNLCTFLKLRLGACIISLIIYHLKLKTEEFLAWLIHWRMGALQNAGGASTPVGYSSRRSPHEWLKQQDILYISCDGRSRDRDTRIGQFSSLMMPSRYKLCLQCGFILNQIASVLIVSGFLGQSEKTTFLCYAWYQTQDFTSWATISSPIHLICEWLLDANTGRCRPGDYVVTRYVCDTMAGFAAVRVWLRPSDFQQS